MHPCKLSIADRTDVVEARLNLQAAVTGLPPITRGDDDAIPGIDELLCFERPPLPRLVPPLKRPLDALRPTVGLQVLRDPPLDIRMDELFGRVKVPSHERLLERVESALDLLYVLPRHR